MKGTYYEKKLDFASRDTSHNYVFRRVCSQPNPIYRQCED